MSGALIPDEISPPDGETLYPVLCADGALMWCTRTEILGMRAQGYSAGTSADQRWREEWANAAEMQERLRRDAYRTMRIITGLGGFTRGPR